MVRSEIAQRDPAFAEVHDIPVARESDIRHHDVLVRQVAELRSAFFVADELRALLLEDRAADHVVPVLVAVDHVFHRQRRDPADFLAHDPRLLDVARVSDNDALAGDPENVAIGVMAQAVVAGRDLGDFMALARIRNRNGAAFRSGRLGHRRGGAYADG